MPDRRRLLLGVTKAEIGGAQRHVLDLARGLADRWEVHLVVGDEGWLTTEARRVGCTVHVVPMDNGLGPAANLRAVNALRSVVRRLRPDVVHLHSSKMGFLGRLACRKEKAVTATVYTAHGWAFGPAYSRLRRMAMAALERRAAAWSDAIIVVSQADRRLAAQAGIPLHLVTVVHNGVSDGPTRRDRPSPHVDVGMLARLAPPKDPLTLVRAVARLDGVRLTLFGDGPLRTAAEAEAERLGVGLTVVPPPHDDPWLGVDVAVLASHAEGFPLVILEAMRAGLPVVASDVGGVREAIEDGITGFLVPAGDDIALAERLSLLQDRGSRNRLGAAGRRRFEQHFRLEPMVAAIERVYAKALDLPA